MNLIRLSGPFGALAVVVVAASPCLAGGSDVRVIVGFKGAADASVVGRHGGEAVETHEGRGVIVAKVSAAKLASLRADASVAFVEEDGIVEASGKGDKDDDGGKDGGKDAKDGVDASGRGGKGGGGTTTPPQPAETLPWGIATVWSNTVKPAKTGLGVKVAVVDTGIDLTHPDLQANIKGSKTYVSGTSTANDDNGHGTHVAGTIAAIDNTIGVIGVAPDASLYAVKVLDARGSGYSSSVASGIDWARTTGVNLVNMSLGGGYSADIDAACTRAANAGVLLIAAAGNSGDGNTATDEISYPAALATVVSVGATDSADALAGFSNTNSDVEVSGPGVSIYSTLKGGTYGTYSGTSMATPHAVGVAAVLWSTLTSPTAASVRAELQSRATDLDPVGRDNGFGYGRVDLVK